MAEKEYNKRGVNRKFKGCEVPITDIAFFGESRVKLVATNDTDGCIDLTYPPKKYTFHKLRLLFSNQVKERRNVKITSDFISNMISRHS